MTANVRSIIATYEEKEYRFKIYKSDGFLVARCIEPGLTGVITQAKTEKELEKNIREALQLALGVSQKSQLA